MDLLHNFHILVPGVAGNVYVFESTSICNKRLNKVLETAVGLVRVDAV